MENFKQNLFIVFIVVFGIYLATTAPTVDFIDSGELAAVAYTLGIAHPTGYPVFTLIGWLFSHIPVSAAVIFRLNVMNALFCTLGIIFYILFLDELINMVLNERKTIYASLPW